MRTIALLVLSACLTQAAPLPRLRVSQNGHFFVKENGSPFFYLGDTSWSLFHLTREDVDLYLKDRAAKKFTVIQAIVAHYGGLEKPNPYGQTVFVNNDPKQPNEKYFQHVDYAVNEAESLGLYVTLVPIWSKEYVTPEKSVLDKTSAFSYGKFLGTRYRNKPVMWILGGDWVPDGTEDIWRSMAAGITEGDGGTHLKTYHPRGQRSSSMYFQQEKWLDFNMLQSGHTLFNRNYELVTGDYAKVPTKPVVDGESAYEGIANNLAEYKPGVRLIQAEDVRRIAYCGMFAGAAGYTYGSNGAYSYLSNSNPRGGGAWGPVITFREALDRPAGKQMQYLRNLIEARPMLERVPDQWLIVEDPMSTTERIQACRAADRSYAYVYIATGKPVKIRLRDTVVQTVAGKVTRAYWYDPRRGTAVRLEDYTKPAAGDNARSQALSRVYTPPSSGPGNDWVLVLEDASRNFPEPGKPVR